MSTANSTEKRKLVLLLGAVCLLFSGWSLAAPDEGNAGETSMAEKTEVAAADLKPEPTLAPTPQMAPPSNLPPPGTSVDLVILGVIGGAALIAGSSDGGSSGATTTVP